MASPAPATTQQQQRSPLDVEELLKCGTSKPLPFIVTDEFGMFHVDPNTAQTIEAINKPLVVVSIVGKYRTGKSFFMNRLAGSNTGFSLGCATEAQTKGIWVWPRPHPDNDKFLLLLDTEGLGNVQKGDEHHDMWIFVMAVLMSTTLVWNIMGVLDQHSLEQLNFITNITEHVQTKNTRAENEQEVDVHNYFPNFIMCIRDFTLELEINKMPCTADEYMEHSLNPSKHEKLRKQREKLCTYLKNRKCFVFQRPVEEELLKNLENVADDKLRPAFFDTENQLKDYVLKKSPVKQINSVTLTGPSFLTLVEDYVKNSNNSKFKLCIESTLTHVVKTSNKRAKNEAIDIYSKKMESVKTKFPLPAQELCKHHEDCFQKAMELFNQNSVLDREKTHIKELKDNLEEHYRNLTIENNNKSLEKCKITLKELYKPIQAKEVDFLMQGSIKDYYHRMNELKSKYREMENLGDEKNNVLLAFVEKKETMVEKILDKNASIHEEHTKDNEELNNQLTQEKQNNNEKQSKITRLEEEAKSQTKHAEELKNKNHSLEVENAKVITRLQYLEAEREKAEKKANKSEAEREKAEKKAKESEAKRVKEEKKARQAQAEREKAEKKAKESEAERVKEEEKARQAQAEREKAEKKANESEVDREKALKKAKESEVDREKALKKAKESEAKCATAEKRATHYENLNFCDRVFFTKLPKD